MNKQTYSWRNPRPRKETPNFGPSITQVDQTMSMRTILERYRKGLPLEMRTREPQYHNGEFPDLSQMDLSEIDRLKKYAAAEIKTHRKTLEDNAKAKQEAEKQGYLNEIETLKNQLKAKERPEVAL